MSVVEFEKNVFALAFQEEKVCFLWILLDKKEHVSRHFKIFERMYVDVCRKFWDRGIYISQILFACKRKYVSQ